MILHAQDLSYNLLLSVITIISIDDRQHLINFSIASSVFSIPLILVSDCLYPSTCFSKNPILFSSFSTYYHQNSLSFLMTIHITYLHNPLSLAYVSLQLIAANSQVTLFSKHSFKLQFPFIFSCYPA